MARPQKEPLRAMSEQEEREVQRLVKATSEQLHVMSRAKVLVAVATGKPFREAPSEVGLEREKGGSQLVKRFNTHGLAALSITAGLGHKPTYTSEQHARMLAEVQREPNREKKESDRDLVADVAANNAAQGGAAPRGPRNDSPGAA